MRAAQTRAVDRFEIPGYKLENRSSGNKARSVIWGWVLNFSVGDATARVTLSALPILNQEHMLDTSAQLRIGILGLILVLYHMRVAWGCSG